MRRKLAALKDCLEFGPPKSAAGVRVVAPPRLGRAPTSSCTAWDMPPRALALIYQHATSEQDREIASAMDRRVASEGRRRR
ncbi:hypothetical protein [Micromonospora avicenniae]|uniref:hypothetical protein n=1 Tax=Micromonospora avicenniae TaxID=1198245 RepID=UPI001588F0C9|nr:hypothetical protein [Micromonospora avicenniae]